jgi:hypothetical protein
MARAIVARNGLPTAQPSSRSDETGDERVLILKFGLTRPLPQRHRPRDHDARRTEGHAGRHRQHRNEVIGRHRDQEALRQRETGAPRDPLVTDAQWLAPLPDRCAPPGDQVSA